MTGIYSNFSAQDYVSKMFNQSVDTFYVVTFKKDLYLFPPTTGKKNQKQRLSLIMPAFNGKYLVFRYIVYRKCGTNKIKIGLL